MDRNIYEMLNDANIDEREYQEQSLSEFELKKMKNNFKKAKQKNKIYQRTTKVAGILAISILALGIIFNKQVYAAFQSAIYELNFMSEKDLDDYKTMIGKEVKDSGYSISLKEVILDRDELITIMTVVSDKPIENEETMMFISGDGKVINPMGKSNNSAGYGQNSVRIDQYTYELATSYVLPTIEDLNQDFTIKVSFDTIELNSFQGDEGVNEKVNGNWSFVFQADTKKLQADTKTVPINKIIALDDGQKIKLKEFTSNKLSQKIYYEVIEGEGFDLGKMDVLNEVELTGRDDLGNEVQFFLHSSQGGKFVSIDPDKMAAANAKVINLDVNCVSIEPAADIEEYSDGFIEETSVTIEDTSDGEEKTSMEENSTDETSTTVRQTESFLGYRKLKKTDEVTILLK